MSAESGLTHVIVGGVRTVCLSRQGLMDRMTQDCRHARQSQCPPKLVFSVNGHAVSVAGSDKDFRDSLAAADIVHADGQVIVAASRLLTRTPIPERSATTDMFRDAGETAAREGLSFYLLGGTEEVNAACAERMPRLHPGLRIAGRRNGYFKREDEPAVCEAINASGADIIWVGLGKPKEQQFAIRNRDRLTGGWLLTCGGCFNFVTDHYSRAPMWMQNWGLEWIHRLAGNPRQLAWRYATTNPHALYLIMRRTGPDPAAGSVAR